MSSTAVKLGSTINQKVIQPTASAINDPGFQQNMSSYMNTITTTVADAGTTGFNLVKDAGSTGLNLATSGVDQAKKWMEEQGLQISPSSQDKDLWNQTTPITPNVSSDATPYTLQIPTKKSNDDGGWDDF